MWKVLVFASFEAVGSSMVLVCEGGTTELFEDTESADEGVFAVGPDSYPGLLSTAVAYGRKARIGLNAGRAELRSRELDRRAAIVAGVS